MSTEQKQNNYDLLMGVPITISVEIGKTSKPIKEILNYNIGSIVELDSDVGSPVSITANGKLVARGDIVVSGDNYAVRVTEIIK